MQNARTVGTTRRQLLAVMKDSFLKEQASAIAYPSRTEASPIPGHRQVASGTKVSYAEVLFENQTEKCPAGPFLPKCPNPRLHIRVLEDQSPVCDR